MGRFIFCVLLAGSLLLADWDNALATNPIEGNTHSFDGTVDVAAPDSDVRVLLTGDLDNDGYPGLVYGAGVALAVIENDSTPLDDWPSADWLGPVSNPIADAALADFDRDGWVDIVSVTEGPGSNEVRLWQNPTMPFTNSWVVSNTLTNTLNLSVTCVAVADLDVDGFSDLVIGESGGGIRLWSNPLAATAPFTSSWGRAFSAASVGEVIRDLAVADVDQDGRQDIVTVAGNTVRVWRNPGTPFATSWTVSNTLGSLGNDVASVVIGDLDNDGWMDVAVGDVAGNVILWRNPLTSTAQFTASWSSGVDIGDAAGPIHDLFVADLDNDGDDDLVSAGGASVQTWQNDDTPFTGTWALTTLGTGTDTVYAVRAADVDRDGDADVVSGSGSGEDDEVVLWPNTLVHRKTSFLETGHIAGTLQDSRFWDIVSVDLDGDGDLDLITGGDSHVGYELIAWENNGTPFDTGWPRHDIGDLSRVYGVAVGDLDGDGDIDVVSGQDSSPRLLAWENDGTPFAGSWTGQSLGTPPTRVEDVAVGDLDNDGDLDVVAATGLDQWSASNNYRVITWENDGSPFADTWNSNDVYTVTYSVHAVAVGDLDNDGWLDIVAGVNHAPAMGSASDPISSTFWYENYELRAYRNDGAPFTGAWSQTNVGRDPETVTFATGHYHGYWGATIYSVALADLDNDGDLDIISGDSLEADYQIKAWENDGTPFDGQPEEQHWTWQPTAVWVEAPWMASSIYEVTPGDINNDGYADLVTASGEFYETVAWENDGRPFGSVISDTTWIRHNLGQNTSEGALSVTVGDLDQDGDSDIVHGSGPRSSSEGDHDVVAWRNQSGSVRENVGSTAPDQILQSDTEDVLGVSLVHGGISADHDVELAEWRLLLEESTGDPLTSVEANSVIENLVVYLDDGDASWEENDDTQLLTITNLSLVNGVQTLTFVDGDPLVQVGPDDGNIRLFVAVQATSDASSQTPNTLSITFDPDVDSIIEDRTTDTSVSVQDTVPVSTGLITFVGPPTQVVIEDSPTRSGNEVFTATLGTGDSLIVYANSHDAAGNFRENVAVTWSLTGTIGHATDANLAPAGDNQSATFHAGRIGAARLLADHATFTDDTTSPITVTLEIMAAPNPAAIGNVNGAIVTATLANKDFTSVADGTVVTFTASLGDFAGQATVTRTTIGGVATATLTSDIVETATVTVTGNTSLGWMNVVFVPSVPSTVTLVADPNSIVASGVATSAITAMVVNQYANPVADGTVVTFATNLGSFHHTPYTATTSNGVATAVLTSSISTGQALVTATVGTVQAQTTVQFIAGEPYTVTVEASPESIGVGGQTSSIAATVEDVTGNLVTDGTVVTFTTDSGSFPSAPYTATTSGGIATAILTSDVTAGQVTVTVEAGTAQGQTTILFTAGEPHTVAVGANPDSIGVGGETSTITAMVWDAYGNLVADDTAVVFTASLGSFPTMPTIRTTTGGAATAVLTSSTQAGVSVVTATSGVATGLGEVTLVAGDPVTLTLSTGSLQASVDDAIVVTATLVDQYGNAVTDGTQVTFTTSMDLGSGGLSPEVCYTTDGVVATILTSTLTSSGVLTATTIGDVGDTTIITFTPGALAFFGLDGYPDSVIAGSGFSSSLSVTAHDMYGNIKTDFVGPVYFDSSDLRATLPFTVDHTYIFTAADAGQHSFAGEGFVLRTAGTQWLTVTNSTVAQASGSITVAPAALGSFQVTAPTIAMSGVPFSAAVTAYDVEGNLKTDYTGTVDFTSSDVWATLPTDDGTGWASGASLFTLTLYAPGSQIFTITHGAVAQSSVVVVGTGTATTITLEDAADGTGDVVGDRILVAGNSLTVYAVARDDVGNFVETVAVVWSLVEKTGGVTDGDLTPSSDGKSATFTGQRVGAARVQAVHANMPTTATGILTVDAGILHHLDIQLPSLGVAGRPFTMTITARDQFSNAVTGFSNDLSLSTYNGGIITPTHVPGTAFVSGIWTGSVTLSEAGDDRELRVEAGDVSATATIDLLPIEEYPRKMLLPLVLYDY